RRPTRKWFCRSRAAPARWWFPRPAAWLRRQGKAQMPAWSFSSFARRRSWLLRNLIPCYALVQRDAVDMDIGEMLAVLGDAGFVRKFHAAGFLPVAERFHDRIIGRAGLLVGFTHRQ